jgi:hypothetical protein
MFRSPGELVQYQLERMEHIAHPKTHEEEMKEKSVEGPIKAPSLSLIPHSNNYEWYENEPTMDQKKTFEQGVMPKLNESETHSIDDKMRHENTDVTTSEDQQLPSFCFNLPSQEMSSSSSDDSDSVSGKIPHNEDSQAQQNPEDATRSKMLSNVDSPNNMSPDNFKNENNHEQEDFFYDPDNDQGGQHSTINLQSSSHLAKQICPQKRRRAPSIEENETSALQLNDGNLTLSLSETPIATKNNHTKKIKFAIIDEEEQTSNSIIRISTDSTLPVAESIEFNVQPKTLSLSQRHIDASNDFTNIPNQEKTLFSPQGNLNGSIDLTDTPDQGSHGFNSSNLTNTPRYTSKEHRKAKIEKLARDKRQGKPRRCIYVDEEAECSSDSSGDDYDSLQDSHAPSQDSFINDSSQLGHSQNQQLSQDQNITSHRLVDALNVEQSLYSTPMLRRKNQLTQSSIPSSEKAIGKMNFIKSVLEHHRKGGNSNDIEREYNRLLIDSKNSQGSEISESAAEQTYQAHDSNDTKYLTKAKRKSN